MRKYYKIFRIDTPFVEIHNNKTDMYDTYFTSESCLVQDCGGIYESEEKAEKILDTPSIARVIPRRIEIPSMSLGVNLSIQ